MPKLAHRSVLYRHTDGSLLFLVTCLPVPPKVDGAEEIGPVATLVPAALAVLRGRIGPARRGTGRGHGAQDVLAAMMGVGQTCISRWERGGRMALPPDHHGWSVLADVATGKL